MPVAPYIAAPGHHFAVGIEVRLEVDAHRRAERRPRELVFPRPHHFHGTAGRRAREQRRVERNVVGAIVAITSRALGVLDHDPVGGELEREGQVRALVERPLGVRPDVEGSVLPLRHRARGTD